MSEQRSPEEGAVSSQPEPAAAGQVTAAVPPGASSRRLMSLDAFRGLTILGMLLVNNVALDEATPRHLTHADWSGQVHFADLVFPWFLFIVGVAIPYAAASHRTKKLPAWSYYPKVTGRATSLFLLGLLVTSTVARQPVFGLGVLQLIGLAYFTGAVLYALPPSGRLGAAAGLLLLHWGLIRFVPLPDWGAGHFSEARNIIDDWNQRYLAPLHLAGLLSVLPTSALVLIGTAFGDVLRRGEGAAALRNAGILAAGGLGLVLSGLLWSRDLPMNKPLWTAPYILYAAGWGALTLGLLYALIDVRGWRAWAFPFIVPGMNAIAAYVAPILVKVNLLQTWTWPMPDGSHLALEQALQHGCYVHAGRVTGGWLYTAGYIGVWWLVLLILYRKQVFLRV